MRVVLQRVHRATVSPEGHDDRSIGKGYLLLVGLECGDGPTEIAWMADKIAKLRLFPDAEGRMNLPLSAVEGACLAVSQFTLLADAKRGRRPSFVRAMSPKDAEPLFDHFVEKLAELVGPVPTGVFGAHMDVSLVNDGPVTLLLERSPS